MTRLYKKQELLANFGSRFYFRDLFNTDSEILVYIAKRLDYQNAQQLTIILQKWFVENPTLPDSKFYEYIMQLNKKTTPKKQTEQSVSDEYISKLYDNIVKAMVHITNGASFKNILDIGTEDDRYLQTVRRNYKCDVFGINIEQGFEHYNRPKTEVITYDGVNIPFPDKSMDLVTIYSVMHHVPKDIRKRLIEEICRVSSRYILMKEYVIRAGDQRADEYTKECIIEHELYAGVLNKAVIKKEEDFCDCAIDGMEIAEEFKKFGFDVVRESKIQNALCNTVLILLKSR